MEFEPKKWKNDTKKKLNEYKRVLQIASKPDREEFEMAAKVTGAGIILIGAIGFVFYMASALIPQYIGGSAGMVLAGLKPDPTERFRR